MIYKSNTLRRSIKNEKEIINSIGNYGMYSNFI